MMKLVFFGTPEFAIPSLYSLHKSIHDILAVVTMQNKPAGRGLIISPSPIKEVADKLSYPTYQPDNLNDPDFLTILNKLGADIFVVVAYRILPEEVFSIPRQGAVNIHASLLPRYRGAAPIHHAILNGDKETGVTTFKIQHKVDTGKILLQEPFKLNENITSGEVYNNLAILGGKLIVKTLNDLDEKHLISFEQDNFYATSAPKISPSDCLIDWHKSSQIIHNQIRAFSPHPGAYTYFQAKRVKLFNTKILKNNISSILQPGAIDYSNNCLKVGTGTGIINIFEIQIEGKKRLPVNQFIKGYPSIIGNSFG